ncbi:MAG: ATP-binding protein [Spirosomataceae bacterium]
MKIQTKFIGFIILIHLITIALSFVILQENKLLFIGSEVFILLSLVIAFQLYQELMQPLTLLMSGIDAIRERDFNVKFLKTGKREVDQLVEVYNQMIDQLRQEKTIQEEQHYFLEKLVQTSPTGIIILDFDEKIDQINPKAAEILGLDTSQLTGRLVSEINHPVFREITRIESGQAHTINLNGIQTYKCQKSHFIDRGFPRHFIMLEELTAEILAAEKKAYGKVIRMMAHEVNNSIGAVNSILDTSVQLIAQPDLKEVLQVAIERNQQLNHFMRRFADVVRLPEPQQQVIDLHEMIQNVAKLMQFQAKQKQIKLQLHLSEGPFWVRADPQQLEQVLINITKNALEAVEHQYGEIKFRTTTENRQFQLIDNGKGILPKHEEEIFSPFFTTKREGQGVGLTLVREILVNHQVGFSLKTLENQTVFSITF